MYTCVYMCKQRPDADYCSLESPSFAVRACRGWWPQVASPCVLRPRASWLFVAIPQKVLPSCCMQECSNLDIGPRDQQNQAQFARGILVGEVVEGEEKGKPKLCHYKKQNSSCCFCDSQCISWGPSTPYFQSAYTESLFSDQSLTRFFLGLSIFRAQSQTWCDSCQCGH